VRQRIGEQDQQVLALRVSAHHAYVTGMRVSGIMHRSIVRLERDKTL
jgi:hypothetical protein